MTNFTRFKVFGKTYRKFKRVVIRRRWLPLVAVMFLLANADLVKADTKNAADYFKVTNTALSPARPYIEFQYLNYDFNGTDDAVRNVNLYVKIGGTEKRLFYTGSRWNFHLDNTDYGVVQYQDAKKIENDDKEIVRFRYYPSRTALQKGISSLRLYATWDIDDDGGNDDYTINKTRSFSAGITFSRPEGTFKRLKDGKVEFSVSGVPVQTGNGNRVNIYDFSKTDDSYQSDYGYIVLNQSATSATYTLKPTFDPKKNLTIYYHGASRENLSLEGYTVCSRFDTKIYSATLKGCAYPSNLSASTDMWSKYVKLTWTGNTSNRNTDGKWYIFRQLSSDATTREMLGSVAVGTTSYTDKNAEYDTNYTYTVSFGLTDWNIDSPVSNLSVSSIANIERTLPMTLTATGNDADIQLSWTHGGAIPVADFSFDVYRSTDEGKNYTKVGTVSRSSATAISHSYKDIAVTTCISYFYQIRANVQGKEVTSSTASSSITGNSCVTDVTVSKGTYSNMVKVTWEASQVGTDNTKYVVLRRLLGSSTKYSSIYTTQGSATSYYFEDNTAAPGQYYEYAVQSYANCSSVYTLTNEVTENGFSQSTGTVSGRITYGTGTAVPDTKVSLTINDAENTTKAQFYAMRVNNLGGGVFWNLAYDDGNELFAGSNKPFSIQMWVCIDDSIIETGSVDSTFSQPLLIDAYNAFSVFLKAKSDGLSYTVYMRAPKASGGTSGYSDYNTGLTLLANEYYHLTLSSDGNGTWKTRIVSGDSLLTYTRTGRNNLTWSSSIPAISFGTNLSSSSQYLFTGYMDEVRVWTKELTDSAILRNYNRLLAGTETDLQLYWPFDEGISNQQSAYDYSKTGGVANGNHGTIASGSNSSTVTPSADQLSLYGLTDTQGNYVIRGIPFSGDGTNYTLKPTLGIHEFSPQYQTRYVSSSSLNHSAVDFTDVSSFEVNGIVRYENSDYPVEGVNIYVDGTICSREGEPIVSGEDGTFVISVPIGDHYITVKKNGHTFTNNGRYPADAKETGEVRTFEEEIGSGSPVPFYDNTRVTLVGRVVGGSEEASKPLGLAQNTNNIGQATIKLKTAYNLSTLNTARTFESASTAIDAKCTTSGSRENGEWVTTIVTDSLTGEFSVLLPPADYTLGDVTLNTNSDEMSSNISSLTIDLSNPNISYTDSVTTKNGVDTCTYHDALDINYYIKPTLIISNSDTEAAGYGDSKYVYSNAATGEVDTISLYSVDGSGNITYRYGYPVFTQYSNYGLNFEEYELYTNYDADAPVSTKLPVSEGEISIVNNMGTGRAVSLEDGTYGATAGTTAATKLTLDSLGKGTYLFQAGFPNIVAPYTLGMSVSYDNNGETVVCNNNPIAEGVVFGCLPSGNNFVTSGPDDIQMILRDPPGSGSSASFSEGTTVTKTSYTNTTIASANEVSDVIHAGGTVETAAGFGVMIITENTVTADVTVGVNINASYTDSGEKTTTTTLTKTISTSDDPEYVGAMGDVFIGAATNTIFGKARQLAVVKDVEGNDNIGRNDVMTTGSTFGTVFNYTQNHIENYLIPNYIELRNSLLTQVSEADYNTNYGEGRNLKEVVYITTMSVDDENLGSENYDTGVWGSKAVSKDALAGPSYIMITPERSDTVFENKVRWYNSQIELWETTLAQNEKAKLKAINDESTYKKDNYSFDAGTVIENTVEDCSGETNGTSGTFETQIVAGIETGLKICDVGTTISATTTDGVSVDSGSSTEEETCTSTSFTLADGDAGDYFSVDVFNAPDGYGAIFRTRGGQTSCPYEDAEETKYYQAGTELAAATVRRDWPEIEINGSNIVSDIPAGSEGLFTLRMQNLSESNDNMIYQLKVVDNSNPDGAILSVDGQALTSARDYVFDAEETLNKTLKISQSQTDVLDYENIGIVLMSSCQNDPTTNFGAIADTVWISAHFVPTCSDVTLQIKDVVMNTYTSETLAIVVKDYNLQYSSLKAIRIQYKGARDTQWSLAKEFVVNVADKTDDNELLTSGTINYNFPMSAATFTDQTYLFRAVTVCNFGTEDVTNESETLEVVKDMTIPVLLGQPNPSDGILETGDEISVVFNENIKYSSLNKAENFVVTGILNGYTIDHNMAYRAQGGEAAYTEANFTLAGRSFSLEMWLNYSVGGSLFATGTTQNRMDISIDENGHLVLSVGGKTYTSTNTIPANKWVFVEMSYDYENASADFTANVAYDSYTVNLFNSEIVGAYTGYGRVYLGEGLTGSMHDVCLWNTVRPFVTAQSGMYTAKTASTPYLAGYWKMDEGNGTIANDEARSRHLTLPVANSWYINNDNKAIGLSGNAYVDADISSVSVLQDADYAFELWFCGTAQNGQATLLAADDSLLNVGFNASGALTLMADGKSMILSSTDYLDNAWHHLAINVLRNGNTVAYVDGTSVKQFSSDLMPTFEGAKLTLGALRYLDNTGNWAYRNYFTGAIDEVRLWNASLTADVLRNRRYTRLSGTEAGLKAYYPFEVEGTDEGGQTVTNGSLADASGNSAAAVNSGATYTDNAPSLQQARTESNVAYSFVGSNNKIVITLDEDADRLEACTINFTVQNVLDANNNASQPVTWMAYVNQNQLIWADDEISIKQQTLEGTEFMATVSNMSGKTENWILTNVPTWLKTSADQGTLTALSSKTLTFTVLSSTPIGKYEETLYLSGNEGIYVPFTISLQVTGEEPQWNVDPTAYETSMNVIGQLQLDGVASEDADDKVAAFVNGECVGLASPVYYSRYDSYYVIMDIYMNSANAGAPVSFKVWDASTGITYPVITTSRELSCVGNQIIGSMKNPFVWNAENKEEQSISLAKGWNWMSVYVNADDMRIAGVLDNIKSSVEIIKGKTSFAQPANTGWAGLLTQVAVGNMYKIQANKATELDIIGERVVPSETPVTVNPNWNWIGYNASYNLSVADAFASLDPQDGDVVKGQTGFAMYEGYEWVGTLDVLAPGKGYMYQSAATAAKNFTYPSSTAASKVSMRKSRMADTHFTPVSENTYSGNMTILAVVKNGDEVVAGCEVGVFAGNECRTTEITDENGIVYFTVAGEGSGSALVFKLYINGEEVVVDQNLAYADDATYGTPSEPYEVQLVASALSEAGTQGVLIYPTRATDYVFISAPASIRSIELTDLSGKVLLNEVYGSSEALTQAKLNVADFADGMYLIVVKTANGAEVVQRIVK